MDWQRKAPLTFCPKW